MIEEKRKKLLEKIHNSNLVFDNEEQILFQVDPEIQKEVITILATNENAWCEELYSVLPGEILSQISPEFKENFWTNCIKYIVKNDYSKSRIEDILCAANPTIEFTDKIMDIIDFELAHGKIVISQSDIDEGLIIELLDKKRYDLISQLNPRNFSFNLTTETIDRILNDYPFDSYKTPIFLKRFVENIEGYLEKFDIEFLYELLKDNNSSKLKKDAQKTILNRVRKLDETQLKSLNFDWSYLILSEDNSEYINNIEIAFLLYKNNILDLLPYLIENPQIQKEELTKKLIEYINNKNEISKKMFLTIEEELLSDKRIINALIDNGFIEYITNPTAETYARIEKNIQNNNPKYQRILENFEFNDYWVQGNLLDTIIKSPMLKNVTMQNELDFFLKEQTIEFLKKILLSRSDVIVDIYTTEIIEELFPYFLKQNNIENLNNIINRCDNKEVKIELFTKYTNELTDLIKNNLYFSKNFLNVYNLLIIQTNKDFIEAYLTNPISAELLLDYVNHHEQLDLFYSTENFNVLKDYFSKKYGVSIEHLEKLEKISGPKIIRYIDNENIQNILKMSEENFEKLLKLFPETTFTMVDLEAAYDSLKQYEFSKKYPDEISIFPNLLHAIEDKNKELVEELIEKISKYLDLSFYKKFNEKYELSDRYKEDATLLMKLVVEKIIHENSTKREKYIDILHEITDYYILKKREEYRTTYDMEEELLLPYEIEEKNAKSIYVKILLQEVISLNQLRLEHYIDENGNKQENYIELKEYIFIKLKKYNIDESLAIDCINYYVNNKVSFNNDLKIIKSNIRHVIKSVEEILEEEPKHSFAYKNFMMSIVRKMAEQDKKIKRTFIIPEISVEISDILASLNIESLEECVFSNEEVYQSLLNTMRKRKLHILPNCLKVILDTEYINVSDDYINLASFISYYAQIYDIEKKKIVSNNKSADNIMLNLINILINAEVYSAVSSVYSQILGDEDAKLIKANPGPNSASYKLANNGRLKEAIELTKKLFLKQEVTIPTFINEYNVSEQKKLKAVVGNFTHPSNLTHGERTGACMRIGGVGESLFYFAIDNPNAFHIRFEDPETHEYISRVTGFRNGNTVFLNELRHSCNKEKYDDTDIIEACKKVAEQLIEESKNSPCPIENVVIHKAYAMDDSEEPIYNLGTKNIKEGLPHFYTDVSNNVVVLATTANKDKPFVDVNFDKSNVPKYKTVREKARVYTDVQAVSSKINRINSVKKLLDGENYEYIEPIEFNNGLTYAIVSEDWYIYVDGLGNIYKDAIQIDPRAKEELAQYLIELETKLNITNSNQEVKYGL